jgi:P27 family predicted phage terminase small subunit
MAKPDFVMVETTDKGYAHVNPWFQVSTQAMKQMKAFASEFGLTPASRSRIDMGQASEDDEFTAFLQRGNGGPKPG